MIFSVSEALRRTGEYFPIELTVNLAPETYIGRELVFTAPAKISGRFACDGKAIRVEAEGNISYEADCARCAKRFVESLSFPIRERFVRDTAWEEDDDTYPYTREQIDLTQPFWDNLFLHLPLVSVCKSDCLGLCPICGKDRNTEACTCQTDPGGGPFGALQTLLNENKEV